MLLLPFSFRLLDDHCDALPNPDTHRGEPEAYLRTAAHLVYEGREDASPGTSEGVAE
jgi:hypothetical protein